MRYKFTWKLTDEEKDRLCNQNGCFRCRELGHTSRDSKCILSLTNGRYAFGDVEEETPWAKYSGFELQAGYEN